MKPLIIHEYAEAELWEEVEYYQRQASGLGLDFLSEVEHAFGSIQDSPERWQEARQGTRRVMVRRFPHTIYYRNLSDSIWIVAVAPQRRRPFYWRHRLSDQP